MRASHARQADRGCVWAPAATREAMIDSTCGVQQSWRLQQSGVVCSQPCSLIRGGPERPKGAVSMLAHALTPAACCA